MKRFIVNSVLASLVAVLGMGLIAINAHAEEGDNQVENTENVEAPKTSMTLTPVSRTLEIASNSVYDGNFSVTNNGAEEMKIEVYAAPYSYVYSEEEDSYQLGFSNENNFTQISRWIKIKDKSGNYVTQPGFTIPAGESLTVEYQIKTPASIPAGGQYAVIFAQTVSSGEESGGIRTEASAGMILYGRSTEGESKIESEIRDLEIGQGLKSDEASGSNNNFYGIAKVKNTGNVDFFAKGTLKVEPIIGFSSYETANNTNAVSIIPESERVVQDEWAETPDFGLYRVTWTVVAGENTETIEKVIFVINPIAIIITIIILTIIVVSVIIGVRKRKERRSRLAI
ncbi:hypothetical protein IJH01_01000 [Candidatus Saccharibacteria bacterium]|nr:hypothetical protein [Candidatus Saccharibacteria bacterium]